MKLVAGLGNPGPEYELTRHNAGFMAIDEMSGSLGLKVKRKECFSLLGDNNRFVLIKPQTFMNNSGEAVVSVLKKYELTSKDLIVIYDDLDIPAGKIRIRKDGGSGGHKGVKSIISMLNSDKFDRIRVGIGAVEKPKDTVRFVLSAFSKEEAVLLKGAVSKAAEAAIYIEEHGVEIAMNKYN
jgi:PTH1 family peptidyl-tRNA hydrolase